jgi:hypothetical protein
MKRKSIYYRYQWSRWVMAEYLISLGYEVWYSEETQFLKTNKVD